MFTGKDFGRVFTWFGPFDNKGAFLDSIRTVMKVILASTLGGRDFLRNVFV